MNREQLDCVAAKARDVAHFLRSAIECERPDPSATPGSLPRLSVFVCGEGFQRSDVDRLLRLARELLCAWP